MRGRGRLRSQGNGRKSGWSEQSEQRGLVKEMNMAKIRNILVFKMITKDLRGKRAWLVWVCKVKVCHGLRCMLKFGRGNP